MEDSNAKRALGGKGVEARESEYGGKRNSPSDIDIVLKNHGLF